MGEKKHADRCAACDRMFDVNYGMLWEKVVGPGDVS
jgi:hypothetical protein